MANSKNTAITFILGVAAGAVAGILLAPDSGANTRTKWKKAAIDLKDNINTQVQDGYNKINQLKEEAIAAVNKTIKKGEDVAWVNESDATRQIYAEPDTIENLDSDQPLSNGDTYIFTFEDAGTFNYYDPDAPDQYHGTVIVEE